MNTVKRLLYAFGQIGMMGLTRYFFMWIIDFSRTTSPTGAALFAGTAVGAVVFGFRIFDGITDPVAGLVSDRWVRRGRERRKLLWYSLLVPPAGLALCFLPSHGMDPSLRWALLIAGLFIFFVGYTFYAIPYWSLIDDYSGDDHNERRLLSTILGAGLMIATGIGFVVSPLLVDRYGFAIGALLFAIPGGLMMTLPYFAQPKSLDPKTQQTTEKEQPALLESLRIALGHRRFVGLLILFSGSQMSFTIMTAAAPFIAVDLLGGSRSDVPLLLGPLLGGAVVSFVLVPKISRRIGWERGLMIASLGLAGVYGLSATLGSGLIGTPMTTAMVIFTLGGPMTAVLLGLEGEGITACARERGGDLVSTYFGVFNFVVKGLNGVALLIAGALADLTRTDWGITAVRLMGGAAGACLLICSVAYFFIRPKAPISIDERAGH